MDGKKRSICVFRSMHAFFAVFFISCLGYIYYAALTRVHGRLLLWAMAVLAGEGLAVLLNRGECPLTGIQHRLGDEKGFFNLFLPDALARRMVPVWVTAALVGYLLVWVRW